MRLIFNELGVQFKRIAAIDGAKDVTKDFINVNGIRMMETYSDPKGSRPLTLGRPYVRYRCNKIELMLQNENCRRNWMFYESLFNLGSNAQKELH